MKRYRLKIGSLGEALVNCYYDIEYTVVSAYKAIEYGVTDRYKKLEQAFADAFLEETDKD